MWQLLLGALGVYAAIWLRWRVETARWAPPPVRPVPWGRRRRGRDAGGRGPRSWAPSLLLADLSVPLYWFCLTVCATLLAHGLAALLAG